MKIYLTKEDADFIKEYIVKMKAGIDNSTNETKQELKKLIKHPFRFYIKVLFSRPETKRLFDFMADYENKISKDLEACIELLEKGSKENK